MNIHLLLLIFIILLPFLSSYRLSSYLNIKSKNNFNKNNFNKNKISIFATTSLSLSSPSSSLSSSFFPSHYVSKYNKIKLFNSLNNNINNTTTSSSSYYIDVTPIYTSSSITPTTSQSNIEEDSSSFSTQISNLKDSSLTSSPSHSSSHSTQYSISVSDFNPQFNIKNHSKLRKLTFDLINELQNEFKNRINYRQNNFFQVTKNKYSFGWLESSLFIILCLGVPTIISNLIRILAFWGSWYGLYLVIIGWKNILNPLNNLNFYTKNDFFSRHPIYFGISLSSICTSICNGHTEGLVISGLLSYLLYNKAKEEDKNTFSNRSSFSFFSL